MGTAGVKIDHTPWLDMRRWIEKSGRVGVRQSRHRFVAFE